MLPASGTPRLPGLSRPRPRSRRVAVPAFARLPRTLATAIAAACGRGRSAILGRQLSHRLRAGGRTGSGRSPAFFIARGGPVSTIQSDIEARLAASEPDVEVLLAEVLGGHTL